MESTTLNFDKFISALTLNTLKKSKTKGSRIDQMNVPTSQNAWMSHLPNHVLLTDLLLVGSHCSNSWNLKSNIYEKTYHRTQSLDIQDQLKLGIRKFDLRVGSLGPKVENEVKLSYEKIVEGCSGKLKQKDMQSLMEVVLCLFWF
jgi:hypothetical protein